MFLMMYSNYGLIVKTLHHVMVWKENVLMFRAQSKSLFITYWCDTCSSTLKKHDTGETTLVFLFVVWFCVLLVLIFYSSASASNKNTHVIAPVYHWTPQSLLQPPVMNRKQFYPALWKSFTVMVCCMAQNIHMVYSVIIHTK